MLDNVFIDFKSRSGICCLCFIEKNVISLQYNDNIAEFIASVDFRQELLDITHFNVCVPTPSIVVHNSPLCLQMKELNHDNIKSFIGACIEPGHICYLMHCCSRGTVQVSLFLHCAPDSASGTHTERTYMVHVCNICVHI